MDAFSAAIKGSQTNLTPQVTRESTQNPAIPHGSKSPGTIIDWEKPIPDLTQPFDPYGMQPQNGEHFTHYIAAQANKPLNVSPSLLVNPKSLMLAVQHEPSLVTDGSADVWKNHYALLTAMNKGYSTTQLIK